MTKCQIPNGCVLDEESNAYPLCDEDGADRIAKYYQNRDLATSKSDAANEIAWVIEMTEEERAGRPPIYWGHVEEGEGWTRDIKEAFRFETFHKADMRASDCGIPDYEVIEHAWIIGK